MSNEPKQDEQKTRTISVKISVDNMTDTVIKHENGSLLLVALPMSVPKLVGLGFLWSVLNNMTTFYQHAEAAAAQKGRGGIIKAGINEALSLGKKIMPGA
jgi:hypothetical protein